MNYHQALNKIHSQLYMEQLLLKPLSVGRHMFVSGKQDPSRKGIVLALRKQKPCVVTELFKANRRLTHITIRLTSAPHAPCVPVSLTIKCSSFILRPAVPSMTTPFIIYSKM